MVVSSGLPIVFVNVHQGEAAMVEALNVVGRAFKAWWREWPLLMLLNLAWLALQIPIVTGPPATAAMYVMARRVADVRGAPGHRRRGPQRPVLLAVRRPDHRRTR